MKMHVFDNVIVLVLIIIIIVIIRVMPFEKKNLLVLILKHNIILYKFEYNKQIRSNCFNHRTVN